MARDWRGYKLETRVTQETDVWGMDTTMVKASAKPRGGSEPRALRGQPGSGKLDELPSGQVLGVTSNACQTEPRLLADVIRKLQMGHDPTYRVEGQGLEGCGAELKPISNAWFPRFQSALPNTSWAAAGDSPSSRAPGSHGGGSGAIPGWLFWSGSAMAAE